MVVTVTNPLFLGMFYLTIPNASLFLRTLNDGSKQIKSVIRRSKFKEMLLTDLLAKTSKKTKQLGNVYYVLDLVGTESVRLVATTTGPIIRYVDDD